MLLRLMTAPPSRAAIPRAKPAVRGKGCPDVDIPGLSVRVEVLVQARPDAVPVTRRVVDKDVDVISLLDEPVVAAVVLTTLPILVLCAFGRRQLLGGLAAGFSR
jgi:hypothetical protein